MSTQRRTDLHEISNAQTRQMYDAVSEAIGDGRPFAILIPTNSGISMTIGNMTDEGMHDLVTDSLRLIRGGEPQEKEECPPFTD